jgi:hypothetical protein
MDASIAQPDAREKQSLRITTTLLDRAATCRLRQGPVGNGQVSGGAVAAWRRALEFASDQTSLDSDSTVRRSSFSQRHAVPQASY